MTRQTNTPTQATRDRILAALPFPETKLVLDLLPLPNVPINAVSGQYVDAKRLIRRDNTFLDQSGFGDRPRQTVGDRVPDAALRPGPIGPQRQ